MHRRAAIALATTSRVAFQATPWRAALSGPCVSPFLAGFCGRSCFRLYASDSGSASGQDTRTSSTNASSREHPTTSYRVEGSLEYHYEEIQPRSKSFIKYHRFGRWLQSEASDSESIETTHGVRRSGIAMLGLSARRTDASRSASPAYGKGTERSSDFGSSQNNQSQGEEEKVTYDPTKTSFENEAYSAATRHYARYYEPPKYTPTAIYKRIQDRLTATKEQAAERFALLTARYRAFFARFRRKQSDSSSSTHQGGSSGGHLSEILPNPDTKLTVGAVTVAIGGNFLVFIGKLTAAWFSGSGVMFAEALHSLADIVNQALLMVGIQQARRKPDEAHPYGFAPARFVYALISATGVFFLGCGASLYHGIGQLFLEDHMVEMSLLTLSVLAGSFFVEASTLIYAIQVIRTLAKKERGGRGVSFWQYIRSGSDTTAIAVLVEDAVAVTGLAIAAVTLWLTHTTGDPIYDTIGTITVGLGMGYVAVFLIRRNAKMLLGQSLDRRTITDIVDVIRSRPSVHSVHDLKSISYGGIDTRFKAEIQFNGREIAKQVLFATAAPLQSSTTPAPADGSKTESDLRLPTTAGGIAARRILRLLDLSKDQHGFSQKQCEDMLLRYGDEVVQEVGREVARLEQHMLQAFPFITHVDLETRVPSFANAYDSTGQRIRSAARSPIDGTNSALPAAVFDIVDLNRVMGTSLESKLEYATPDMGLMQIPKIATSADAIRPTKLAPISPGSGASQLQQPQPQSQSTSPDATTGSQPTPHETSAAAQSSSGASEGEGKSTPLESGGKEGDALTDTNRATMSGTPDKAAEMLSKGSA